MANNKSALKRIKIAERNKERNSNQKSKMKTSVIKTLEAIESNDKESTSILKATVKIMDTIARKGIIHKNKANRLKSRLTKKLNKTSK